jgi:hypothetical protein
MLSAYRITSHWKEDKLTNMALKVNKYGDSQTYYGSVITTLQRLKIVPEGSQVPTRTAEPVGTGREGERERDNKSSITSDSTVSYIDTCCILRQPATR